MFLSNLECTYGFNKSLSQSINNDQVMAAIMIESMPQKITRFTYIYEYVCIFGMERIHETPPHVRIELHANIRTYVRKYDLLMKILFFFSISAYVQLYSHKFKSTYDYFDRFILNVCLSFHISMIKFIILL